MANTITKLIPSPFNAILSRWRSVLTSVLGVTIECVMPIYTVSLSDQLEKASDVKTFTSILSRLIGSKLLTVVLDIVCQKITDSNMHDVSVELINNGVDNYDSLSSSDKDKYPPSSFINKLSNYKHGVTTIYREGTGTTIGMVGSIIQIVTIVSRHGNWREMVLIFICFCLAEKFYFFRADAKFKPVQRKYNDRLSEISEMKTWMLPMYQRGEKGSDQIKALLEEEETIRSAIHRHYQNIRQARSIFLIGMTAIMLWTCDNFGRVFIMNQLASSISANIRRYDWFVCAATNASETIRVYTTELKKYVGQKQVKQVDFDSVQTLSVVFPTKDNGSNITLKKGDVVYIKGHSGSGKTTLIKMLFGLIPGVVYEGATQPENLREAVVRYVQNHSGSTPTSYVSIRQLFPDGVSESTIHKYVELAWGGQTDLILSRLSDGVADRSSANPFDVPLKSRLSGGQLSRLMLWIVVASACLPQNKKKVIVLDEPAPDVSRADMIKMLIEILKHLKGRTVIVAAHLSDDELQQLEPYLTTRITFLPEELRKPNTSIYEFKRCR